MIPKPGRVERFGDSGVNEIDYSWFYKKERPNLASLRSQSREKGRPTPTKQRRDRRRRLKLMKSRLARLPGGLGGKLLRPDAIAGEAFKG